MSTITESYKELNNKYKDVCALSDIIKKEENLEEDDKSPEFLASFLDNSKLALLTTEEKMRGIEDRYKDLISFFGDTPKDLPMDTFIEIFIRFYKDLTVIIFKITYRLQK